MANRLATKYLLNIYITQYVDGTYQLEAKHIHWAFDSKYNADNVEEAYLPSVMRMMCGYAEREGIELTFKFV